MYKTQVKKAHKQQQAQTVQPANPQPAHPDAEAIVGLLGGMLSFVLGIWFLWWMFTMPARRLRRKAQIWQEGVLEANRRDALKHGSLPPPSPYRDV